VSGIASVSQADRVRLAPMSSSNRIASRGRLSGPVGAAPATIIIAITI
jgi:hypothetical protein